MKMGRLVPNRWTQKSRFIEPHSRREKERGFASMTGVIKSVSLKDLEEHRQANAGITEENWN